MFNNKYRKTMKKIEEEIHEARFWLRLYNRLLRNDKNADEYTQARYKRACRNYYEKLENLKSVREYLINSV
jgi:hypothetical protein